MVRLLIGRASHLAHTRAHISIRVGQASRHRHKVEDDKAQNQVDSDAAGHHDYALPPRLFIHRMGLLFLGEEFILRGHASDIAKPAYWEGRKSIFGVALPEGKKARPKANKIAAHAHAKGTRGEHMACFVQRYGKPDAEGEKHNAQQVCHGVKAF